MRVLVTGGAGYVGSRLVPALLEHGHDVTVVDWFLYGETLQPHPKLTLLRADMRALESSALYWHDAIIHLACISNDPSFELDPMLGKSINYDATTRLIDLAQSAGVKRFIYASSSSVYGVKPDGVQVTEDLPLEPITDYSKFKAQAEDYLLSVQSRDFTVTVLRPATLCGYAPRLRLDLIVNILTTRAYHERVIPVLGGSQSRPNLHVKDMVRAYVAVLEAPTALIDGQVFNVGGENATVLELADRVRDIAGGSMVVRPTNDRRSYVVNSERIAKVLGFRPEHSIDDAIRDLCEAFRAGLVPNALDDPRYYNIKQMQTCHIS